YDLDDRDVAHLSGHAGGPEDGRAHPAVGIDCGPGDQYFPGSHPGQRNDPRLCAQAAGRRHCHCRAGPLAHQHHGGLYPVPNRDDSTTGSIVISVTVDQLYAWINTFFWPFVRIAAMVSSAPLLSESAIPARVKVGLAVMLTLIVAPTLEPMPSLSTASWGALWI